MNNFTESTTEETALEWIKDMGYTIIFGGDIAPKNTLRSLRDSLLTKLMRGEVRAKDMEEML